MSKNELSIRLVSAAKSVPPIELSNEYMVQWHGHQSPQWFSDRFGINTRYSCYDYLNQKASGVDQQQLLEDSARQALDLADIGISEIDSLIVATNTPSYGAHPDEACLLHMRLGAPTSTFAQTTLSGCCAVLMAMRQAVHSLKSGEAQRVLVCAASIGSSLAWPLEKEAVWLPASIFGDGACAFILESVPKSHEKEGFGRFAMGANPKEDVVFRKIGGSLHPLHRENLDEYFNDGGEFLFQKVPTNLRREMRSALDQVLKIEDLALDQFDWILFNMSNGIIQREWLKEMGIPEEKSFFNIDQYGNCAAASFGMVLADFFEQKKPKPGQKAILLSVGTGLQFGGVAYYF